MKIIIALLIAGLVLLTGCSSSALNDAGDEVKGAVNNFVNSENKYVKMVKGAVRDGTNKTYEQAFSAFFGTPRWNYFLSTENQNVVEFTGDCLYQDVEVRALIQFIVDEDEGIFTASYLSFNDVPQNLFILAALIDKAFE